MWQESSAGLGQANSVARTGKQPCTQLVFQQIDALADSGLRDVQVLRSGAERAKFADGAKGTQVVQVHLFGTPFQIPGIRC